MNFFSLADIKGLNLLNFYEGRILGPPPNSASINDIEHSEITEVQKRNHGAANHYRSEYSQRNIEI